MTRDPFATAARELLDHLDTQTVRPEGSYTRALAAKLRSALEAHHETHRSREVHPLALAYLEAGRTQMDKGMQGPWAAAGCPIYAAPDPHHASQHEADATLGRALREAREAWGQRPLWTEWSDDKGCTEPGDEHYDDDWSVYTLDDDNEPEMIAGGRTELEALRAALAAAPARRDQPKGR